MGKKKAIFKLTPLYSISVFTECLLWVRYPGPQEAQMSKTVHYVSHKVQRHRRPPQLHGPIAGRTFWAVTIKEFDDFSLVSGENLSTSQKSNPSSSSSDLRRCELSGRQPEYKARALNISTAGNFHSEALGRPGVDLETEGSRTWCPRYNFCNSPKTTGDVSSKKAHFTFSNSLTLEQFTKWQAVVLHENPRWFHPVTSQWPASLGGISKPSFSHSRSWYFSYCR